MSETVRQDPSDPRGPAQKTSTPLSRRLERILSMIRPAELLADIGTDHAYVPIEAVRRGLCGRALACDVVPGPLVHARENITAAGCSDRIEIRRGDGLKALGEDRPQCIVIAGMGGALMGRILWEGWDKTENDTQLVLSPQSEWMEFRTFLTEHHWRIRREAMVEEEGKYYLILDCIPDPNMDAQQESAVLRYGDAGSYVPEDLPVRRAYIEKDLKNAGSIIKQLEGNDSAAAVLRRRELEDLMEDAQRAMSEDRTFGNCDSDQAGCK